MSSPESQEEFEQKFPLPSGVTWNKARNDYVPARVSINVYKAVLSYRKVWQWWQNRNKPPEDIEAYFARIKPCRKLGYLGQTKRGDFFVFSPKLHPHIKVAKYFVYYMDEYPAVQKTKTP